MVTNSFFAASHNNEFLIRLYLRGHALRIGEKDDSYWLECFKADSGAGSHYHEAVLSSTVNENL